MNVDWQVWWQAVEAVGTGVGAVLILVAGIYAVRVQLPELRRSRNAQIAYDIFKELRSPEMLAKVDRIEQLQIEDIPDYLEVDVRYILDRLELLGVMVGQKVIDERVALQMVRRQPLTCWYKLKKYIKKRRESRGRYAENLANYARLSVMYQLAKPVDERTLLNGVDLVEKLREDEDLFPPGQFRLRSPIILRLRNPISWN